MTQKEFKISPSSAGYLLDQRTQLQKTLAEAYLASCRKDAKIIHDAVMGLLVPRSAVDLGGGLGGVSACLSKLWTDCEFTIADRDGYEGRKINFGEDFGRYNRVEETAKFLSSGGVRHRLCNIDESRLPSQADVVFSVLSWGFHYPIATHADWAASASRVLVIDCRAGTGADRELRKKWASVTLIEDYPKHEWYLCKN